MWGKSKKIAVLQAQNRDFLHRIEVIELDMRKLRGYIYKTRASTLELPSDDNLSKEEKDFYRSTIEYRELMRGKDIKSLED